MGKKKQSTTLSSQTKPVQLVGAIDIGSNSIRLGIAQVSPDGSYDCLERIYRALPVGQDTFRRGHISPETMRGGVTILRDFKKLLAFYNVDRVRVVATSAVRESDNADMFLDRISVTTGFDVEMIDTTEESRLFVSAVRTELGKTLKWNKTKTLIADVGGGSTLLTVIDKGEIIASQSLRLGSIRMQESLATANEPPERAAEILRTQIANELSALEGTQPLKDIRMMVAIGGDARFAARCIGHPLEGTEVPVINKADLNELVSWCENHTPDELVRLHGLAFADAETVNPALMVIQALLHKTRARQVLVSGVSMRDGLLLDMARVVTGHEDKAFHANVIHSALTIAEKYHVDVKHARRVSAMAVRLFDALIDEHGLSSQHRLMLEVAALLHNIGSFVSNRSHHKHSFYLIAHSEIFGLSQDEMLLIAHIARYHRRSVPKPAHIDYMHLPREYRMVVSKLAALLRIADALQLSNARHAGQVEFEQQNDEFIIYMPGATDLIAERRGLEIKGDLFEDMYCLKVRLEEKPLTADRQRRARAID